MTTKTVWLPFRPALSTTRAGRLFFEAVRELAKRGAQNGEDRSAIAEFWRREACLTQADCDPTSRPRMRAAIHLLADLYKQGWDVRARASALSVARPAGRADLTEDPRDKIRAQLHSERDEQLREPATAQFVRDMEGRRVFDGEFVSIFSLMRDGRELAKGLQQAITGRAENDFVKQASDLIQPYLQFVDEDRRCAQTGLRLMDIWRYFRHTWASPYKSVPGRSMLVLLRDAAAPFHPVMGISALSSAAVALAVRDEWVGWTPRRVIAQMRSRPTIAMAVWLRNIVDTAIAELYNEDFIERKLINVADIRQPTEKAFRALSVESDQARRQHRDNMASGDYKKVPPAIELGDVHWLEQARSPLFRSKRASELADLLSVRMVLQRFFGRKPSKPALIALLESGAGRDAVARVVRKVKAERVGTAMTDLTVCGAVPPYNEILCGKLMALLMASPEVAAEYRRRYGKMPSVIASSMAGRAIIRPTHLVLIGTTSLYGQRPCQYDRIRFAPEGSTDNQESGIRYDYLGRTEGIGTFQFGKRTVEALTTMLNHSVRGQQVNSVFGEGVNPRLRKIRDGLTELGLNANELLRHGAPRLVYCMRLAHNMMGFLLGQDKRPRYILPQSRAAGHGDAVRAQMIDWWIKRWLLARVQRAEVLERMRQHNFVHPIRHGARVVLPRDRDQPQLFDD